MAKDAVELTQAAPLSPESSVAYVGYAFAALGMVVLVVCVFLYARYGGGLLGQLEAREPHSVFREGMRCEESGDAAKAISLYRRALTMEFHDYWTEEGCKQRLTALLIKQGRVSDSKTPEPDFGLVNVLANGGFEDADPFSGWTDQGAVTDGLVLDAQEKVEGKRALRLDFAACPARPIHNVVLVLPGVRYRVWGWMRTLDAGPGRLRLVAKPADESGPQFAASCRPFVGAQDWTQFVFDFTPPQDVRRVALTLEGGGAAQAIPKTGYAWLDGCALTRTKDNLIKNASFEIGEGGRRFWQCGTPPGVEIAPDPTVALEGRQSLRIQVPAAVAHTLWQSVEIQPGVQYRLSARLRSENLAGKGVQLVVKDALTNGKTLARSSEFMSGAKDWTGRVVDFTAPPGVYTVLVALNHPPNAKAPDSTAPGTFWADALGLESLKPANAPTAASQPVKESKRGPT